MTSMLHDALTLGVHALTLCYGVARLIAEGVGR